MIRKAYSTALTTLGPRSIRAICSTGDVDRTGEIVVQAGLDLSLYKKNPIVLFSHSPELVIGTASNVGLRNGNLCADIAFAPEGISKKADEVCALVKAGILKSISIGFDPTSLTPMDPARPRGPQKYNSAFLVELSIVAVPCNPNAVITDKSYQAGTTTQTLETPNMPGLANMTRAERIAKAAAIAARGQRHVQTDSTPRLTGRAAQIQRDGDHAYRVLDLQRKANPTAEDRRAAASRIAFKDRPAGY